MNIFRLAADMLHLLSFIVMLYRMKTQRSCRGVSLKSQILFLIVFCCRYLVLCAQREAREAREGGARSADPR
jgi:ER lumen protein retaining receptor